jgi:hypothetical protein
MSKNVTSASIVASLLLLWLVSGLFVDRSTNPDSAVTMESGQQMQASAVTQSRVRVELKNAETWVSWLRSRARWLAALLSEESK